MRDRSREVELLKRRRELERVARERTAAELLASTDETGNINGAKLSRESFAMLRDLIGRSSHRVTPGTPIRHAIDAGVRCEVRRVSGARTLVESPEGRLAMHHLVVTVVPDAIQPAANTAGPAAPSAPRPPAPSPASA